MLDEIILLKSGKTSEIVFEEDPVIKKINMSDDITLQVICGYILNEKKKLKIRQGKLMLQMPSPALFSVSVGKLQIHLKSPQGSVFGIVS